MRTATWLALASALCAGLPSRALEVEAADPKFTLVVPGLPQVTMHPPLAPDASGTSELQGDSGSFHVAVSAQRSPAAVTPRECAGRLLRAIVARPGMPKRDDIYRAPLSDTTFLVLYELQAEGHTELHAHLLSAVNGTHCVEARLSRPLGAGEDVDEWRHSFSGARVVGAP